MLLRQSLQSRGLFAWDVKFKSQADLRTCSEDQIIFKLVMHWSRAARGQQLLSCMLIGIHLNFIRGTWPRINQSQSSFYWVKVLEFKNYSSSRMAYWLRGHEGERNNCFSKIQLVGQKDIETKHLSLAKARLESFFAFFILQILAGAFRY